MKGGRQMKASAVRFLRLKAEIDIDNAVQAFGISKSMFYKIELGYRFPSAKVICRMSDLYGCTIDEIYKALGVKKNTDKKLN
jgi:putative transcriptional regulator